MLVSVLIPAYNEGAIIQRSLETVRSYLETRADRYTWELVVVDDGSRDDTAAKIEASAADDPRVHVVRHPTNRGLGRALRDGFIACRGQVVVTLDADLTYAVDHIDRLVEAYLTTQAAIVIASPYMAGGEVSAVPWTRLLPSRVANRLLAAASNARLSTFTGMVRAYDARFLRTLTIRANGMDVNAEILRQAHILRERVVEIPAHLDWHASQRVASGSSFRLPATTLAIAISAFLFRPVMFFLIPGVLLGLLAIAGWTVAVLRGFGGIPLLAALSSLAALVAIELTCFAFLALQIKRSFEDVFGIASATYARFQEGTPS